MQPSHSHYLCLVLNSSNGEMFIGQTTRSRQNISRTPSIHRLRVISALKEKWSTKEKLSYLFPSSLIVLSEEKRVEKLQVRVTLDRCIQHFGDAGSSCKKSRSMTWKEVLKRVQGHNVAARLLSSQFKFNFYGKGVIFLITWRDASDSLARPRCTVLSFAISNAHVRSRSQK